MIHPWNQPIWQRLEQQCAHLPHALLLAGPAGIGKRALAEAWAARLLCQNPTEQGACGACQGCHWLSQGTHPDLRWIEPEEGAEGTETDKGKNQEKISEKSPRRQRLIGVDSIRQLGEFVSLSAHQHGWRVAILAPAEAMNTAAANALLKTLEEPPSKVLLILVSHHPRRLLPTVRSRCQQISLPLPERERATQWLQAAAQAAGQPVDGGTATALLDEAGGAPLLALEYADSERQDRQAAFVQSLVSGDPVRMLELARDGKDAWPLYWGWLMRWVQDVVAARLGLPPHYFRSQSEALARLAARADLAALLKLQQGLGREARSLQHPLNTQLLMERWLLAYAEAVPAA